MAYHSKWWEDLFKLTHLQELWLCGNRTHPQGSGWQNKKGVGFAKFGASD